jgi:hypothetical protein
VSSACPNVTNDLVPELRDPVIVERIAVRDFSENQDLNESDWRNANATRSASDTRDEIDRHGRPQRAFKGVAGGHGLAGISSGQPAAPLNRRLARSN